MSYEMRYCGINKKCSNCEHSYFQMQIFRIVLLCDLNGTRTRGDLSCDAWEVQK